MSDNALLAGELVSRQVHMAEPGDYHEAGFRLCLALNSGYSILSTGGNGVTFVLFTLGAGLTLGTLGKFWAYPCIWYMYQGRQDRVRT